MIDLGGFEHEIVSTLVGMIASCVWKKARRVAKDVNALWPRLRDLELEVQELKKTTTRGMEHELSGTMAPRQASVGSHVAGG